MKQGSGVPKTVLPVAAKLSILVNLFKGQFNSHTFYYMPSQMSSESAKGFIDLARCFSLLNGMMRVRFETRMLMFNRRGAALPAVSKLL